MKSPRSRPQNYFRRHTGFMVADVMMALGVLVLVVFVFISATSRTDRAADRLAGSRHAGHVAEEALSDLQANLPLPQGDAEIKIAIEPVDGGAKIPGHHWVRVVVNYRAQSAALIGIAPEGAATQPGGAR